MLTALTILPTNTLLLELFLIAVTVLAVEYISVKTALFTLLSIQYLPFKADRFLNVKLLALIMPVPLVVNALSTALPKITLHIVTASVIFKVSKSKPSVNTTLLKL